jgi:hypothetical protein
MKTNLLKYYILAFYMSSTIAMFAQPGTGNTTDDLEQTDPAAAPIDNYVWILAAVGLVYVFLRIRTFNLQVNTTKK